MMICKKNYNPFLLLFKKIRQTCILKSKWKAFILISKIYFYYWEIIWKVLNDENILYVFNLNK